MVTSVAPDPRPTPGRPTADFADMAEAMDAAVPAPDPERTLYGG